MGYWQFIFQHEKWFDLYEKNCSLKTQDQWFAEGKPNISIGLIYFISGLFYELTYIPFLVLMLRHEFFQHSCYKLMFLMGIIDILVLPCNGIITGYQVMKGEHFCENPKLYYLASVIGVTGYHGVTTICVILAFDRFLEMCFPKMAVHVFGGKRVYFWMFLPILYMFFTGTQLCHIFSVKVYAMNHDPFYKIHGMEKSQAFDFAGYRKFFVGFNITIMALLICFYGSLLIVTKIQTRMFNMPKISKMQKLMTLQAICVCGEMFFAPLLHIFMLFWEFPDFVEIIAHWGWITLHGDTPIIYFILNRSLRKAVIEMLYPIVTLPTASWRRAQGIVQANSRVYTTDAQGPITI